MLAKAISREMRSTAEVGLWTNFRPNEVLLDELLRATQLHDFAVLVATPDDRSEKRGTTEATMRDNVLFELGLFAGSLGRERTYLLQLKGTKMAMPSDLEGFLYWRFSTSRDALDSPARIAADVASDIRKRWAEVIAMRIRGLRELQRTESYRAARELQIWVFKASRTLVSLGPTPSNDILATYRVAQQQLARWLKALTNFAREHATAAGVAKEVDRLHVAFRTAAKEFPPINKIADPRALREFRAVTQPNPLASLGMTRSRLGRWHAKQRASIPRKWQRQLAILSDDQIAQEALAFWLHGIFRLSSALNRAQILFMRWNEKHWPILVRRCDEVNEALASNLWQTVSGRLAQH
jgi:hypothetical protein